MTLNDDEPITLSSHALDALQQFYSERDAHTEKFERLKVEAEDDAKLGSVTPLSIDAFREDWQESQFWYSDETAYLYAKELLKGATDESTIAVVSTPSVFIALKNILNAADGTTPKPRLLLLEHDRRFSVFAEFIFYDLNEPLKLPSHLKGSIDRLICDPPFLNEDTQTKAATTLRWLVKPSSDNLKVVICTGERMAHLVTKLYKQFGVRRTTYEPEHRGLQNEFCCYANFKGDAWEWKMTAYQ